MKDGQRVWNDANLKAFPDATVKMACISCVEVFDNKVDLATHMDNAHVT